MVNLLIWNNQGSVWFSSKWPEKSWQLLDLSFAKRSDHFWSCLLVFYPLLPLTFRHDLFSSSSCYCLIMTVITTAHIIECLLCAKHSAVVLSIDTLLISVSHKSLLLTSHFTYEETEVYPLLRSEERTGSSSRWLDLKRMNDMWTLSSKDKTHQACFLLIKHMDLPHSMRKWKHSTEGEWVEK